MVKDNVEGMVVTVQAIRVEVSMIGVEGFFGVEVEVKGIKK